MDAWKRASATRRDFLLGSLRAAGALTVGSALAPVLAEPAAAGRRRTLPPQGAVNYGPLQPADANGILLPNGFTSRVVAVSRELPAPTTSSYVWHDDPDGGAVFAMGDGGWVYTSNSERTSGSVGALRFDAAGNVSDAYSILTGTERNCAGGPAPWGTWLSCEEHSRGEVWECDPTQPSQGVVRPALGSFQHEAVAVDTFLGHFYLTEDRSNGLLYRFTPNAWPDLSNGLLEAAQAVGGDPFSERPLVWHAVPNPNPSGSETSTRFQVPLATTFNGGEGIWYRSGFVYFATKGDDRVWRLSTFDQTLTILYDPATSPQPILSGVDNVYVTPVRDVFVAEDGGNMEIVALTHTGSVVPVLRVNETGSEITGPCLSPDGTRLYFSSQRGGPTGDGITFEVSGPFLL